MAALNLPSYAEGRQPKILILVASPLMALFLAWQHAFWRDEVRAFSLAIQGGYRH